MTRNLHYPCTLATVLLLAMSPTMAQDPASTASSTGTSAGNQDVKPFTQQELDQLLAPIALYPDALLAQIFMASTYPLEIVEAARWSKANAKLTGKALEDALVNQPWDPAVKSLTAVPSILAQMNEKLDWTKKLGDAFLGQQKEVMATVQSLRAKADAAGNLKSSEQMVVTKETQATQTIYVVESPKTEVVYVPTYNPTVVYGTWWYPAYPPYYFYPPYYGYGYSYGYSPGLTFAAGVVVGAALWGNCNWNNGDIDIDVNRSNNFNRTSNSNRNWNHNSEHRKGVSYRDQGTSQKFNRGSDARASQSREQFRGRAESGRGELSSMDKNSLNQRGQNADRNTGARGGDRAGGDYAAQRPIDKTSPGGGDRGGAGGNYGNYGGDRAGAGSDRGSYGGSNRGSYGGSDRGGFSGVGNSAATRDASARGSASRSSMGSRSGGGGMSRGGGGGGRRR